MMGIKKMKLIKSNRSSYRCAIILCDCGYVIFHPNNRWRVMCPECKQKEHLHKLRALFAGRGDIGLIKQECKAL